MAIEWGQVAFRVRNDDGSETTATWLAGESCNYAGIFPLKNYRLRITIDSTGSTSAADGFHLWFSQNGAAYTRVGTGAGTAVNSALSSNFADGANTTRQLTLFQSFDTTNLGMDEDGLITSQTITKANSYEFEFCILFAAYGSVNRPGDTFDFRIYLDDGVTPINTYTVTPRLTLCANCVDCIITNVG